MIIGESVPLWTLCAAIVGHAIRSEHRFTRVETLIDGMPCKTPICPSIAKVGMTFLAFWCVMMFSGCAESSNKQVHADNATYHETLAVDPVKGSDQARIRHTIRDDSRGRLTGTQPPTGMQLFGLYLGKTAAVCVIGLAVALFLAPSAVAAFLLRRAIAFRKAFSETVAGVDASGLLTQDSPLHHSLKAAQTPQTRTMVLDALKEA